MFKPYYKIISESDRPFPGRIAERYTRTPVIPDHAVVYPIVKMIPEPIERRHPPALPLIKKIEKIFIKQPLVKTNSGETSRRLRLAIAKAKARIRKIKLLGL